MTRLLTAGSALLLTTAAAFAAAASAQRFAIDPGASHVRIHVGKSGLLSFAGHTHEVAAPVSKGAILLDPDQPGGASVRVEFTSSALRVIGDGEPAGDVPKVQETMEGGEVLDAARFPAIVFESRDVRVLERDGSRIRARVAGTLTLHGVTHPETADVTVQLHPDRITTDGVLKVKQTDYGIEPVTAGAGTVRVKDEVTIEFTLVARPVSPGESSR